LKVGARRYIKGQKYTLLSRKENLTLDGKKALKTLLSANKRLNTAYVLKESFGQLWGYEREGWARRFLENWRASLKWQRLKPYWQRSRDGRRDRCCREQRRGKRGRRRTRLACNRRDRRSLLRLRGSRYWQRSRDGRRDRWCNVLNKS
jgi:hypothetical protein